VLTLGWLGLEYRAWGIGRFRVDASRVELRVGSRAHAVVSRAALTVVPAPAWRDVPAAGTPGYLNLTAPAEPNVLLRVSAPVQARLLGGVLRRSVTTLGVHVDDPLGFAAELASAPSTG
jgi:hypothetical protein